MQACSVAIRGSKAAETSGNQAANHASRMKRELCLRRYKTIFILFFRDCLRAASPSPAICFNLLQLCSGYLLRAQRCGTYREWGAFARMHHSTSPLRMPYNLETCTALLRFMKEWHDYSLTQLGLGAKHLSALLAGGAGWLSTILLFSRRQAQTWFVLWNKMICNIWPNRFVSIQLLGENTRSRLRASKGFKIKFIFLLLLLILYCSYLFKQPLANKEKKINNFVQSDDKNNN